MGKNKLIHFNEITRFVHVFEPSIEEAINNESKLKGNWAKFFNNNNPITLELGCGKGEYTLGMAKMYPNRNFIGVDIKGARIWRGAKTIEEEGIDNAAFLRMRIEFISSFFDKDEVDEIWLTFSDPQLKDRRAKHRLTHPRFLDIYAKIINKHGTIHLKTDSRFLADYTLEVLTDKGIKPLVCHHDIYGKDWENLDETDKAHLNIKTFYEQKFLDTKKQINYIRFQLNGTNN